MTTPLQQIAVPKGARIFQKGDSPDYAYIIDLGEVRIMDDSPSIPRLLAILGEGDIFGEMAIIDDQLRSASAIAEKDCVLSVISRDTIHDRLERCDAAIVHMMKVMTTRLRNAGNVAEPPLPHKKILHGALLTELRVDQAIRSAILGREFVPFFQPIVSLSDYSVVGYEALARWRSTDGAYTSPADFVPVAERSQAIRGIDLCILDNACRTIAELIRRREKKKQPPIYVAVNFSGMHFSDLHSVKAVEAALSDHDLHPSHLCIEVTENVFILQQPKVMDVLNHFKDIGVLISIDDFGSGYSNLGYLQHLPINTLKIDRSFVADRESDGRITRIAGAIAGLAHSMDMKVIAEGIETLSQARVMAALGCDCGQGYYFGKPQSEETLLADFQE
ncbi:putative Diguanylate phosphodiesterase [Azospirillaceae bacterium]